tara:strand:- start:470 stop:637 length:168 start_codon:yes stop_codon:yes gene_type:complete
MISCPNCGYSDNEDNFPRHPEKFMECGRMPIAIIICPNCKGADILEEYIEVGGFK